MVMLPSGVKTPEQYVRARRLIYELSQADGKCLHLFTLLNKTRVSIHTWNKEREWFLYSFPIVEFDSKTKILKLIEEEIKN